MKLPEYIQKLQDVVNSNPEYADLEVIYARDDEGNGYQKVCFDPSIAFVDDLKGYQLELLDKEECEEEGRSPNAICIN